MNKYLIEIMSKNIEEAMKSLDRAREALKASEDHDCHADVPDGHCDHPSHPQGPEETKND